MSPRIRAAVLGRPIAHSKSPQLHQAAYTALGLEGSDYGRFDVGDAELEAFLDQHPDHTGFSLTMPLKERLVELALDRGWTLDDTSRLTGVGNTLVRGAEVPTEVASASTPAATTVLNTDVRGIEVALGSHLPEKGGARRAVILGAGATALSAVVACHRLGVDRIEFLVRNPSRAERALELCRRLGIRADTAPLSAVPPAAVFISTLPAEAAPAMAWSEEIRGGVALDVAYAASSSFLKSAAERGVTVVEGTAMLVEQAVEQFLQFLAAASAVPRTSFDAGLERRIATAMYAAVDTSV